MPLDDFKFQPQEYEEFKTEFPHKLDAVNFTGNQPRLKTNPKTIGIYFIIGEPLSADDSLSAEIFKLYIGKSRRLEERMNEYNGPFQVKSADDFKHQALASWLKTKHPNHQLVVYYKIIEVQNDKSLNEAEADAIGRYNPLHNGSKSKENDKISTSEEILTIKSSLKNLHEQYVHAILDSKTTKK